MTAESTLDTIHYRATAHVAELRIDRPAKRNAFDGAMASEVLRLLAHAADDRDVRVVVLTGTGTAFSAGGDIAIFGVRPRSASDDATSAAARPDPSVGRGLLEISELLATMPKVTIAAVNGVCAGGALGWACACDLRVAARSARFVPAFTAVAQTGDYGITWSLPRLVGAGRAADLLFVGDAISADDALAIGLVTRVADDDAFPAVVADLAAALAARAPLALAAMKANLVDGATGTLAQSLDAESARMAVNMATADAAEAAAAFLAKRTPQFEGR